MRAQAGLLRSPRPGGQSRRAAAGKLSHIGQGFTSDFLRPIIAHAGVLTPGTGQALIWAIPDARRVGRAQFVRVTGSVGSCHGDRAIQDLCLDAGDPGRLGAFWASVLGRAWEAKDDGDGLLTGPAPQHTIWVNRVPEANAVKHRVHLDVYARDLADLRALGATVVEPRHGSRTWTIMADPEGGEFCAFSE